MYQNVLGCVMDYAGTNKELDVLDKLVLHASFILSPLSRCHHFESNISSVLQVTGHPDSGAAAKAEFVLNQISTIQHFSQTNRVEDMRVIVFVVAVLGFSNLFNVKFFIFIVGKVAEVFGFSDNHVRHVGVLFCQGRWEEERRSEKEESQSLASTPLWSLAPEQRTDSAISAPLLFMDEMRPKQP